MSSTDHISNRVGQPVTPLHATQSATPFLDKLVHKQLNKRNRKDIQASKKWDALCKEILSTPTRPAIPLHGIRRAK